MATTKPKNAIDKLIENLEKSRPMFEEIMLHGLEFKAMVYQKGQVRLNPHDPGDLGTKLRDFDPTNPLEEWLDVTDRPYQPLALLEKQGLICTIKIEKRHYSRISA